ncbi:MAG: TetR/AcrR family transcriptional regulator [Chloroflexi bacterium HGW-Chloroflexi-10]|nr:MAG: TetR/AcrR family transcriptional regulator [Chloroflexi bacterium HGW-Chloroflexi-10]
MTKTASSKKQLLETAARLFYQKGYRAIGVDTITEESGIGKMTLYRHFESKNDLIVAYLRASDTKFWEEFEKATKDAFSPRDKLVAFFRSLSFYVTHPNCCGCPFLNAATEYPDSDYPGHIAALEHKESVRQRFRDLARQAGARNPGVLADQLYLLMDGAYMAARLFKRDNPGANVVEAAIVLIDAQITGETQT